MEGHLAGSRWGPRPQGVRGKQTFSKAANTSQSVPSNHTTSNPQEISTANNNNIKMASNRIIHVSSTTSSHELAHFLSADGIGAGFVRHEDIWSNNDEFLGMVWTLIRAPRRDGRLMKLLYIRNTVIETEMVVRSFDSQRKGHARCGVFPNDEFRVAAMTFGKARQLFVKDKVLCENMVILVDGTYMDTVDTQIAMGLMNQSVNPASCVKILGLYGDDWDNQAAEKAVPVFSPLLRRAGVQKLSVTFAGAGAAGARPQPTLVDQRGLIDAMVECVNQGKHIAFFLPHHVSEQCTREVRASPDKVKNILLRKISLTGDTSMGSEFDRDLDVGQIFETESYLVVKYPDDTVRVCSMLVAIDPDAGFRTIPFKRVGLVVYSHITEQGARASFKDSAGVPVHSVSSGLVDRRQMQSQLQACRGLPARHVCLYSGALDAGSLAIDYSKEFVFELVRSWPGKRLTDMPLGLEKRDKLLLRRTMRHLAVAGMVGTSQDGFVLTETKGAEMARLLPIAGSYGLSFELASLVASARHGTAHVRSKRLLVRLAVMGAHLDGFLAELTPALDENHHVSLPWMEEAQEHMAGPARDRAAAGRLWFALGIWEKLRNDTDDFSELPEGDDMPFEETRSVTIQGIGKFCYRKAVEIWTQVLDLEDRAGLPLLGPSNPGWQEPLTHEELYDVQFQLLLAFISNLAVWDLGTGQISLVSSGHALTLDPTSLVAHAHMARLASRPQDGYIVLPDRFYSAGATGDELMAKSVVCMEASLLRVVKMVLGESAVDWLTWP